MTLETSAASATDKCSLEIVSLLGERVCITLAPSATIADLRSKLAATPPFVGLCNVNIVHRGRQLDADAGSSLSDEGIADGDVIHAFSTSASMSTSRSFAARSRARAAPPPAAAPRRATCCGATIRRARGPRRGARAAPGAGSSHHMRARGRAGGREGARQHPAQRGEQPHRPRAVGVRVRPRRVVNIRFSNFRHTQLLVRSSRGRVPHATRTHSLGSVPGAG